MLRQKKTKVFPGSFSEPLKSGFCEFQEAGSQKLSRQLLYMTEQECQLCDVERCTKRYDTQKSPLHHPPTENWELAEVTWSLSLQAHRAALKRLLTETCPACLRLRGPRLRADTTSQVERGKFTARPESDAGGGRPRGPAPQISRLLIDNRAALCGDMWCLADAETRRLSRSNRFNWFTDVTDLEKAGQWSDVSQTDTPHTNAELYFISCYLFFILLFIYLF